MRKFKNILLIFCLASFSLLLLTKALWVHISWNFFIMMFQVSLIPIFGITFFTQLPEWIESKFKLNWTFATLIIIPLLIISFFYTPTWLYNLTQGENLLVARSEGGGNCQEVLLLKENNLCEMRTSCFGLGLKEGSYAFNNDT